MTTHSEIDITALIAASDKFAADLDRAIMSTQQHMALADIDPDDDNAQMDAYEERFHCEVCVVREVLDGVWPVVTAYLDILEQALGIPQDPVK